MIWAHANGSAAATLPRRPGGRVFALALPSGMEEARASLRTGVRPVGNGLDHRCLLGARAPPGSNPPPSRGLRSSPLPRCAWHKRIMMILSWHNTVGAAYRPGRLARCWTAQQHTVDRGDVNRSWRAAAML